MDDKSSIFITHILQNIEKIESFTKGITEEGLLKSDLKQYAVVRAIEIIGEAAKNLSDAFKIEHSDIPWKEIIGVRDKMIHHYFGIDLNIVWNIIKIDLRDLKNKLNKIRVA